MLSHADALRLLKVFVDAMEGGWGCMLWAAACIIRSNSRWILTMRLTESKSERLAQVCGRFELVRVLHNNILAVWPVG